MEDIEKNQKFKLEIEINSNLNNTFCIIFTSDTYTNLNITAINKNDIFKNSYSNNFTVEKIKENKYFLMFDDLKEICEELSERIKKEKIELKENNDNSNIILTLSLPAGKLRVMSFELNKDTKDYKEQIKELSLFILDLKDKHKKDIIEIKEENKQLKNEVNELKNENIQLKNEILEFKKMYKNILDYMKYSYSIQNSFIINKNEEYIKLLKSWINPNKDIPYELLYRKSRDGDLISTFHSLCDNKGPTLTLIEIDDGNKIGIYTPLSWDNNHTIKKDMETFMFNLNKKQKYKKIKQEFSIHCYSEFGPYTNNFGFYNKQMKTISHGGLYIESYEKGSEILPNNSHNFIDFKVKEIEIFKVLI